MDKLRVVSWFSGIGAFEEGMKELGIDYNLVNYCEFEKYPSKAYSLIHNVPESLNLGDINNVDETKLEDFDLMTYGFPCFTGDTLVLTDDGYKNIKDIKIGDYVLDHTNQYNKVKKRFGK